MLKALKRLVVSQKIWVLLLGFIGTAVLIALPQDQPPDNQSKQAQKLGLLRETLQALREEKKQLYEMIRNWNDERKDLESRIKSLNINSEYNAKELESLKRKNESLKRETEEVNTEIIHSQKRMADLKEMFLAEIKSFIKNVQSAVPWKGKDRIDKLNDIASDIQNSKSDLLEVLRRLWDFVSEESALIRSCETDSIELGSGSSIKTGGWNSYRKAFCSLSK